MIKKEKHIKIIYWVSIFSFFAGVLPFLVLSFYTFPNLEDYAESIIPEVWWHVKFLYLTYDGRYFASFLFAAFNPLKFKSFFGYQLIPFSLILLLYFSIFSLFKTYLKDFDNKISTLLSFIVLVLFLLNNPSTSYSFYYMISSYVYMVPSIFFIFLLVFLKLFYQTKISFKRALWGFLSAICIIAIAGSNEILLIPLLFVVGVFTMFAFQKNAVDIFLLWVSIAVSFFIVFSSPGLLESFDLRLEPERDLAFHLQSILKTIQFSYNKITHWLFHGFSLWLILLFLGYIFYINKDKLHQSMPSFSLKAFFLWLIFFVSTSLLIVFPYVWATGELAVDYYYQAFIIPYIYFHLGLVITVLLLVNTFTHSKSKEKPNLKSKVFPFAILILLIISINIEDNRIITAYKDWLSGTAKRYANEMDVNIKHSLAKILTDKPITICLLNHKPSTIFSGMYFTEKNEDFYGEYKIYFEINDIELQECK